MGAVRPEVRSFLDRVCVGATVAALPGDVSLRQFFRISLERGDSRVLMDYGSSFSGQTGDMVLTKIFRSAGLPVAEVLDFSEEAGCLLLEDLGPDTLESVLGRGSPEQRLDLLRAGVRLAADVALRGSAVLAGSERADGPTLDARRFRFEIDYFLEHYVAGYRCRPVTAELRETLYSLADTADHPAHRVLCHRDYHSRNLMVRPDGRLAMVDIQDARWGPDSYDLASLLYDAYIDIDPGWVPLLVETFLEHHPAPPARADFILRLGQVATQRMVKALGTFGRQLTRNGSPSFLTAIARTLPRLHSLAPTLTPLL